MCVVITIIIKKSFLSFLAKIVRLLYIFFYNSYLVKKNLVQFSPYCFKKLNSFNRLAILPGILQFRQNLKF